MPPGSQATNANENRVWLPWIVAWHGGPILGIANGTMRELGYKRYVGTMGAHYIATGLLIALLGAYMAALERRWPIPTTRTALGIGGIWLTLTAGFEFGFGHFVAHESFSDICNFIN